MTKNLDAIQKGPAWGQQEGVAPSWVGSLSLVAHFSLVQILNTVGPSQRESLPVSYYLAANTGNFLCPRIVEQRRLPLCC